MAKSRKLVDLYKRSVDVTIGDGDNAVTVAIVKLNDIESEEVIRKANAAQTRVMAERSNPEGEYYQAVWTEVDDLTDEDDPDILIGFVISEELGKRTQSIEAELAGAEDSEWSKDGYYKSLIDAWNDNGLKERYAEDPEDPEAARVWAEMSRFLDQLNERTEAERQDLLDSYRALPYSDVRAKAVKTAVETHARSLWWIEYQAHRAYLTTREAHDHSVRHFSSRAELDECDSKVRSALYEHYRQLEVDVTEGKDSPGSPGSSDSSESPDAEAASTSSGPAASPA